MAEYKQPQNVAAPSMTGRMTANDVNMSVGNISRREAPAAKTSGVKVRGTGAATKGVMARGPMA